MGEEGKKKKLVYEQPRLVRLSGAVGAGQCQDGSGEVGGCESGNAAGDCEIGTSGGGCEVGSTAD
ncbi:MAG TPA: hypothetical protein ACFYD6_01090 [Candidatus Brocadiia bacterium]|nr:hypothetical protein [Candidatus Brocadiales bacterium]